MCVSFEEGTLIGMIRVEDDLLEGVSLPVTSSDDAIAIFTGYPGAARSEGGVVDRNRRSRRRIEPGFFGPVVLPFKGDLFTTPKLAYEVNSFYQARLAFLIFWPQSCGWIFVQCFACANSKVGSAWCEAGKGRR